MLVTVRRKKKKPKTKQVLYTQPKETVSWCKCLKLLELTELVWFTPSESILHIYIWTLHSIYSIVSIIQYTFLCNKSTYVQAHA